MGIRLLSHAEQAAQHLRQELRRGRWRDWMPGVLRLERDLGVNRNTLEAALRLLEKEGWLVSQGAGKRRKINVQQDASPKALRIAVLHYERSDLGKSYMVDLLYQLEQAGHAPLTTEESLLDLGMKIERVARLVERTAADAWLILSGPRGILEWFCEQSLPAFALFGRRRGLPMAAAGPDKPPAMAEVTRRLIELGHQRIVLLARRERRWPTPGATESAFIETLEEHGLQTGSYNLPAWEETLPGFSSCLTSLLQTTPPTAVILDEAPFFTAAMQFFARRGVRVPEDMSLVCSDWDPHFEWCDPPISHIRWDSGPVVRRIIRWAERVGRGKEARRQTATRCKFVEGGTIGPVAP